MILPMKILTTVITWCGAIGMIVVVVFLVKDIGAVIKGEKSISSVLIKVLCVFVILGIMYAAGSFQTFGKIFQNIFSSVVTEENMPDIGQK
jgi:hypothetical protein